MVITLESKIDIGPRTFKTVLCIFICLVIYKTFNYINDVWLSESTFALFIKYTFLRSSPTFACIAGVVSMQNTVDGSIKMGKSRVMGAFIGGAFGLLMLYLDSVIGDHRYNFIFATLGSLLITCFCNIMKKPLTVSISLITFLIIMVGTDFGHPYLFALHRIVGSIIGVIVSLTINLNILRPKKHR